MGKHDGKIMGQWDFVGWDNCTAKNHGHFWLNPGNCWKILGYSWDTGRNMAKIMACLPKISGLVARKDGATNGAAAVVTVSRGSVRLVSSGGGAPAAPAAGKERRVEVGWVGTGAQLGRSC